jgi:hypothetical protein
MGYLPIIMDSEITPLHKSRLSVFRRVLRPLIRFALARRIPIQVIVDLLKKLYVDVTMEEFSLPEKRLTDSRISVLTGLQRKDIKAIRETADDDATWFASAGPLPRLVARWRSAADYQDEDGNPLSLPKTGPGPSFESLVGMISHDIHARTVLDDLIALGLVTTDEDKITLIAEAFLPRADENALLGYLSNNLGDHATAAVANVLSAPAAAPHFERAVHYNYLSADSLNDLEALSRRLQQQTLEQINAHALALQVQDRGDPAARGRFRCGAFILCEGITDRAKEESAQ